ncbi:hypothetical protein HYH03_009186 [Edaphochlamys debaryana]|uniref:Peptidase M11 gametolysin domain-containing protein n=1 Tax=Edaphochlamys debaryana TaxID=47281 RepID=A0A836BXA1_9CHLO|nr:hypothetical protein HYH03_009186 [Edaphochlamys debaryana]|eukprot:KAG2492521.1 hypothetical protein HYH03_009186 [Edaphochlamys debaryana]
MTPCRAATRRLSLPAVALTLLLSTTLAPQASEGFRRKLQPSTDVAPAGSVIFSSIEGAYYAKSDGGFGWSLLSTAGEVLWLAEALLDALGNPIDAGATVTLDMTCSAVAGFTDACSASGAATVLKAPAAIVATGQMLKILTLVTSLTGKCTKSGANATQVDEAIKKAGGYADFFRACSYEEIMIDVASSETHEVVLDCTDPILDCDEDEIAAAALAAAKKKGIDLKKFTHRAYVIPAGITATKCDWAGLAEIPGKQTWYTPTSDGIFDKGTFMQEILHNFGVWHGWRNGIEYEDASTCQGKGIACPSGPELWRLRWGQTVAELKGADLPVGTWKGWYTLTATYLAAKNTVKIFPDWLASYTKNIYFALRGKGGGDKDLLAEFDKKVNMHEVLKDNDRQGVAKGDPVITFVVKLFPKTTNDLTAYKIIVVVGDLVGNVRVPILICRYSTAPSQW